MHSPGFFRLLASLFYETLLVLALLFVATFLFVLFFGAATHSPERYFLQGYLWLIAGAYFFWCWTRGRTLAMQAWKLRLVDSTGKPIPSAKAVQRYILATIGTLALGAGFLWALLDREHRYLHDRLLNTRVVVMTDEKVG